jgi:opacity protein-like surface antigen
LGLGLDGVYGISDRLNVRASYRGLDYSTELDAEGSGNQMTYQGDLDLGNIGLGLDYHVFGGGFRLSAGLQNSDNRLRATATCEQTACEFGNNLIPNGSRADVDVDLSGTHPYLGIGWGNLVAKGIPLGVFVDIGVMLQGTPQVTVVADCTGGPSVQALCDSEAENEERELQEDAERFELYPIVNLGFRWRFN